MKESTPRSLPVNPLSGVPIMSKTSRPFDFTKPVAYDAEAKRAFHSSARRQLKELADALSTCPSIMDNMPLLARSRSHGLV
jgi:hypothetical protein